MKNNRMLTAALILCSAIFFTVFVFIQYSSVSHKKNETEPPQKPYTSEAKADEPKAENQPVKKAVIPSAPSAEKEEYLLRLEDNYICAYYIGATGRRLITSSRANTSVMSDSDIEKLREGIYANNYEDICLYFESWSS